MDRWGCLIPVNQQGLWDKLDLPYYGKIGLVNGTMFTISLVRFEQRLSVGVEGRGSYTFSVWVHWTYAGEKLHLLPADAKPLSDFINCQLGLYREDRVQGDYSDLPRYLDSCGAEGTK